MTTRRSRPQVVYWNNIPAPYVVGRFNAVARRGAVDLEAWFSAPTEPDRSWTVDESTWEFKWRYLPRLGVGDRRIAVPAPLFGRHQPDLLVSLYAGASFLGGWEIARQRGIRTVFRVLPTWDTWIQRRSLKERLKRHAFSRVDAVKVPGPAGAAMAQRYGVPPSRIYEVTQSVDVDELRAGRALWAPERATIRAGLGARGCIFLYVGRLWEGKGISHLFAAFASMIDRGIDATLVLAGDGTDERRYREMAAQPGLRGHVIFAGFVQQPQLPRLYAAADVLVFPTLGDPHGLVVEEAMASALPVITTTAAGDIERRLPDGEAGFIVPPGDRSALAERMRALAVDPALRRRMGQRADELVGDRTHDRYAEDFERLVRAVLGAPRRRAVF
jgi:glycosyltransferase involved in cell wall biosynthesis